MHEVQQSRRIPIPKALKERVSWLLERVEASASRRIGRGMGLLATIGATAPFVGLFGTVWGIMNSFIGISNAHTTNLAVVAPGIAEALLATALGLFAAIPAVVIYNVFARSIGGYRALLADGVGAGDAAGQPRLRPRVGRRCRAPRRSSADGDPARTRRRRFRGDPRDQRHAVHRRDPGAADHLHDRGAARDRRRAGRSAGLDRRSRSSAPTSRSSSPSRPTSRWRSATIRCRATGCRRRSRPRRSGNRDERIFLRADER